ncbi:hypothetical protein [uncultured Algibacter sp.]|uniref:hypothetical protein n=1 Tax=uncultured Algibacter sp. TaxID=298659 RepID=UPI00262BC03A|nr:hypothetical protein [uncultured Algibacter sp.]
MRKKLQMLATLLLLAVVYSCGPSIKVTDSWSAPDTREMINDSFLIIARTDDLATRQLMEQEMTKEINAAGVKATSSYTKYPKVKHNQKLTEADIDNLVAQFKKDGFQGIVLTVLKDVKTEVRTEESGGYTTGGYYPYYYGGYGGFGGYYGSFYSPYGYGGSYVPRSQRTYESDIYKLETVIYDLDREENRQLVAVVSSNITDPGSVSAIAGPYAKKVVKAFSDQAKK